jgi:hypothetical protein
MPKEEYKDLKLFMKPYPKDVQDIAMWLRDFAWDLFPDSNELIYDNYNALAFGWSVSDRLHDTFCSVALFGSFCHFGFFWGTSIADPEKKLLGKGNQYRYLVIREKNDLPKIYVKKLLKEAHAYSMAKWKLKNPTLKSPDTKGMTIVKSISPKKKRPGLK